MRSRRCPTRMAVRRFPARLVVRRKRLLLGVLLFLALGTSAPAQAGIRVSPLSVDFGSQKLNGPGVDGQVQIQNLGPGSVLVNLVQITGADPQDFLPRGEDCARSLTAGASCSTHVFFSPTALGSRSAVLEVFSDAAPPIEVSLTGKGTTGAPLPMITCPSSVSVTAAAGQTTAAVAVGMATATGDGVAVTAKRSDGGALGDLYPVGVTIITWTATDRSLNTITCFETITVQAVAQSLQIRCPPNQAVGVDGSNTAALVLPGIATSPDAGVTIVGVRSDGKALADLYPVGTTTVTWTATNAAGDEGTCAQTITVGSGSVSPSSPSGFIDPSSANPHIDDITPAQGPLYQRVILHGSGFADFQGSSYVLLGGRDVTVLGWSAGAINLIINPLAFNPAPLAINAAYPVQVITPASEGQSNPVSFFLTDGVPAGHPGSGVKSPPGPPRFASFQQPLFCPGDTVWFLGTGFGPAQGAGYVAVTVPLSDPSGNVAHQMFVVPVLSWSDNGISFALSLPAGAIPGGYVATVRRSDGKTTSGTFAVGARNASGGCTAPN